MEKKEKLNIVALNSFDDELRAHFEKVFAMRVQREGAIYQNNEEIRRKYFKTGKLFFIKYRINYIIDEAQHTTDQIILFFHRNGELAYCLFYDGLEVDEYHKFDNEGFKTIEAKR